MILSQIPKLRSAEVFSELIRRSMKSTVDEYVPHAPRGQERVALSQMRH